MIRHNRRRYNSNFHSVDSYISKASSNQRRSVEASVLELINSIKALKKIVEEQSKEIDILYEILNTHEQGLG